MSSSSGVDEESNPIRDPHSTTYTGAIETAEEFARRIYREAFQRGWSRAKIKVILGDGAIWILNLPADQFPGAILIVDFYHAAEHLHKVSRLLLPGEEAARQRWTSSIVDQLKGGDIESIVTTLRSLVIERPTLPKNLVPNTSSEIVHRLRRHRSWLQVTHRPPAQAIWHVLDRRRRQPNHRPSLLPPRRPV